MGRRQGELARAFERQRTVLVKAFAQVESWGVMRSRSRPPSPCLPSLAFSHPGDEASGPARIQPAHRLIG